MAEEGNPADARTLCKGSYSAWLKKVRSEGARGKWLVGTNKRYFTIDFDAKIVFYAHSADQKKVSQPIRFKEIVSAERLPPSRKKKSSGFILRTTSRMFELHTTSNPDAAQWVHALNAARDIASSQIEDAERLARHGNATSDKPSEQNQSDCCFDGAEVSEHDASQPTSTASPREATHADHAPPLAEPQRLLRPKVLPSLEFQAPSSIAAAAIEQASRGVEAAASKCKAPTADEFAIRDPAIIGAASDAESQVGSTASEKERVWQAEQEILESQGKPASNELKTCQATQAQAGVSTASKPLRQLPSFAVAARELSDQPISVSGASRDEANVGNAQDNAGHCMAAANSGDMGTSEAAPETALVNVSGSLDFSMDSHGLPALTPLSVKHRALDDVMAAAVPKEPEVDERHECNAEESIGWDVDDGVPTDCIVAEARQDEEIGVPSVTRRTDEGNDDAAQERVVASSHELRQGEHSEAAHQNAPPARDSDESAELNHGNEGNGDQLVDDSTVARQSENSGWDSDDDATDQDKAGALADEILQTEGVQTTEQAEASGWDSNDDSTNQRQGADLAAQTENSSALLSDEDAGATGGGARQSAEKTPGVNTPLKRPSRVSFKETPEEFAVPVHEPESDCDAAAHGGSPINPEDEADLSDWDSDEEEPVTLAAGGAAVTPSGWDSDDDDMDQPLGKDNSERACGAPPRPDGFVVEAAPVSKVAQVSATDDIDGLVGLVLASDVTAPAPFKGSDQYGFVPGLHCTGCDFQVMRIENYKWNEQAAYMFFRNNYPNVMKLRKNLTPQADCCAFCCQCSWKSAQSNADVADIAEGLRWKMIGA